jgi:NTP pyrophosphatase (non-canonical NTP hydrolase)
MRPTVKIALDWAIRSFGSEHVNNLPIRSLRCAEEAVELAQALKVDKETMHKLVDTVYSRAPGEAHQEIGGVLMTITILTAVMYGEDPDAFFERELLRVLAKPPEHFAKRNQDKIDMGLTA